MITNEGLGEVRLFDVYFSKEIKHYKCIDNSSLNFGKFSLGTAKSAINTLATLIV